MFMRSHVHNTHDLKDKIILHLWHIKKTNLIEKTWALNIFDNQCLHCLEGVKEGLRPWLGTWPGLDLDCVFLGWLSFSHLTRRIALQGILTGRDILWLAWLSHFPNWISNCIFFQFEGWEEGNTGSWGEWAELREDAFYAVNVKYYIWNYVCFDVLSTVVGITHLHSTL